MSLANAAIGRRLRITGISGREAATYRLMELGLIEGAELEVVRRAPLGDPMQVRLGDYDLSLRNREAACVDVTPL